MRRILLRDPAKYCRFRHGNIANGPALLAARLRLLFKKPSTVRCQVLISQKWFSGNIYGKTYIILKAKTMDFRPIFP